MARKTSVGGTANTAALYFTPRLREAFGVIHARPLTVVEAPMGYGKTSAAREFLRKARLRVVWTPILGPSAEACWKSFCIELKRVAPALDKGTEALLRLGFPHDAVQAEAARQIMLEMTFTQPTIFVFDDTHFLPEQKGGRAFAFFCELLAQSGIPDLRLLCITRDAWAGERREFLSLKGILSIIGREAFTLGPEEIREYYARCGFSLSPDHARELHAATGGWISALHLYLLHYSKGLEQGAAPPWSRLTQPGGALVGPEHITGPLMRSLVEKEIYAPLSPALKDLLFALEPLGRVTVEQADFLYGGDTRDLLAELARKNAFIFFDPESGVYSPHSIFRQYITEQFSRLPEERQRMIYRKCGDWFMRTGEIAAGIEAYCATRDYEHALSALESDMGRHLVTEKANFFNEMFKACPEEILERHMGAAFKYAIAAFSAGDFPAFGAQIAWLSKRCAALPPGQEGDTWRGELEVLLSLAAFNTIETMSIHHRRANVLLGRPTGLVGQGSPWTLGSPSVLFMFHRESGKLGEEVRRMYDCLPHYYELASHHGAGGEFMMEAEALYNAGRFAEAEILCHRAEAKSSHHAQLANVLCAVFLRMRLALVAGEAEKAQGLVAAMRSLITMSRDYFLLYTVDLCEGWLHAALGQPEKMPAWVRSELVEGSRLYTFARGWYYIVHGRALLLEKEYARILGLFGHLLESGLFRKHLLFTVYAYIYMAAAEHALGDTAVALATLRKALALALPDDVYMPFVENSDVLSPVLRALSRNRPRKGTEHVFALIKTWEQALKSMGAGRAEAAAQSPQLAERLTPRELELARLSAMGGSFPQIAAKLGLAPSTVKRAFAAMYKKLGVNSRDALRDLLIRQNLVAASPLPGKKL
ncbi:MAG: LuxR C-terminal-related transcriptional regulator [Desulfovibrionaceae bacterium]|nr:LuxR C-terminal-related transcriptional regulator [Desulfovibrionaceae bacterium]